MSKRRWVDNGFIERLWRSVKYEEVKSASLCNSSGPTYETDSLFSVLQNETPPIRHWTDGHLMPSISQIQRSGRRHNDRQKFHLVTCLKIGDHFYMLFQNGLRRSLIVSCIILKDHSNRILFHSHWSLRVGTRTDNLHVFVLICSRLFYSRFLSQTHLYNSKLHACPLQFFEDLTCWYPITPML